MSEGKRAFTYAERFAVWEAFEGRCWWCDRPVYLKDMDVDHIVPESTLDDPTRLALMIVDLGLPSTFEVNDFGNWVPACKPCNMRKGAKPPSTAPAMIRALQDNQVRARSAIQLHSKHLANV